MPLSRDLGAMLRGEATTAQMFGAAILGSLLGFVPGFSNGAGLFVLLVALLVILNVSLPFALLVFGIAKLAGLLLLPVSFKLGQWLVDGPAQPMFRWLVNAPVLALFGFEHYATTGGLLLGLLFGLSVGWLAARAVAGLRVRLAGLETNNPKYRAVADKPWSKVLGWAFLGTSNLHWSLPPTRKRRKLRMLGLIVVALVAGIAVAAHAALTSAMLTRAVRSGLQAANGATVDLERASLDLTNGKLTISGLAFADSAALDHDVFRAELIEADIDTADLLRKRVALDHVIVRSARHGALRATPGKLTAGEPEPPAAESGTGTLEDYVKTAKEWRDRLRQVKRWLETLSGPPEAEPGDPTWTDELEREADRVGLAKVTARHLVEGAPTFLVRDLSIEELLSESLPGEVLDVQGENLSTEPALVATPAKLRVASRSGKLLAEIGLGGAGASAEKGALQFHLKDWPLDRIAQDLAVNGEPPVKGGTFDVTLDGGWAGGAVGQLDLPLQLVLHDTTLNLGGSSSHVQDFRLAVGLRGPLDDPSLSIDDDQLIKALKDAGAAELAKKVDTAKAKVAGEVEKKTDEAKQKAGDALKDKLGGLLGGDKAEEPKKKKKKGDG